MITADKDEITADEQIDAFDVLFERLMGVWVTHRRCLDCDTNEADRLNAIQAFDKVLETAQVDTSKLVVFGGISLKEARERLLKKEGHRCWSLAGLREDLKKHLSRLSRK